VCSTRAGYVWGTYRAGHTLSLLSLHVVEPRQPHELFLVSGAEDKMVRVSPLSSVIQTVSPPSLPGSATEPRGVGGLPGRRDRQVAAAVIGSLSARVVHVLEGHRAPVRALEACYGAAASAQVLIASADDAGVVRLWHVGGWQCVGSLFVASGVCGLCTLPAVVPGSRCVVAMTEESELLFVCETDGQWVAMAPARPLTSCSTASGSSSGASSIALVAGRLLVCASGSNEVRVLELSGLPAADCSGAPVTMEGHRTPIQCIASDGDALFATGSADGVIKVWHPIEG